MEWLAIIVTMVVLWVASLFKILHESFSASQVEVLNDGGGFCKRNVLLVIAHPDDESMFFTPTINYLSLRGCNLHILCMSTGNADGIGNIRKEELCLASTVLKVPQKQVKVLDHPDLQDGFGKSWNSKLLSKIIKEEIVNCAIDLVITFDNYGVSGHCNHQDVHQGVRELLQDTSHKEVEVWELVSSSLVSLLLKELSCNGSAQESMGLVSASRETNPPFLGQRILQQETGHRVCSIRQRRGLNLRPLA
ncbi:putative NAC domain-containing protein 21/22-like [Capsicum annuum]|nr:putative NAC domain-containing protein 21/22-like [Capsicum annuum]